MEAWWYTTPLASQHIRQQVGGFFFDVGLLGPCKKCMPRTPRTLQSMPRTPRTLQSMPRTLQSMPRTLQSMPRMAEDVAKHAEDGRGRCQACLRVAKQAYTS